MPNEQQAALAKVRLARAREDFDAANVMLEAGHYNAANNRAYYSLFHALRAVLALESVDFQSHAQLLGYFNKNYIHTGHFEVGMSKRLAAVSRARNHSDYEDYYVSSEEEAKENVENAQAVLSAVERYVSAALT